MSVIAIYPGIVRPADQRPRRHHPARGAPVRSDHRRDADQHRQVAALHGPERVEIAREVFHGTANVEVDTFDGLLVDYARRKRAGVIVRGLRAISDFEFEMQMALMNRRLNPEVETVFMMPAEPYTYVSSRLVKEIVALGGSVHGLVPDLVERRLREKKLARETLRD